MTSRPTTNISVLKTPSKPIPIKEKERCQSNEVKKSNIVKTSTVVKDPVSRN